MKINLKNLLIVAMALTLSSAPDAAFAQDKARYESIVKELSDPSYFGRSRTNKGIDRTREYIINNLNPAASYQLQEFSYPMNLFEGKIEVYADGKKLENFKDYVVKEFSTGKRGTYKVFYLPEEYYNQQKFYDFLNKKEFQNAFVVLDFDLFRKKFFRNNIETYETFLTYDNYVNSIGKLTDVGGIIFSQKGRPVAFKARAHYTFPFPVLIVNEDFGKEVKEIYVDIESEFVPKHNAANIAAWLPGKIDNGKHKIIIAHMDHLGLFGKENIVCGANDNASGVAMALTLLDYYAKEENRPNESLMFLFVDGEEGNLLGSIHYVANPLKPLEDCSYIINLDMVGDTGPKLIYQVSEEDEPLFKNLNKKGRYFKGLIRENLNDDSDHFPFAMNGVKYLYLAVDGVNKNNYYHSPLDTYENFSSVCYESLFNLVVDYIKNK